MGIFDTHGFIKRSIEAGMPEKQAEVMIDEQVQLIADHLATKDDLKATGSALETKIDKAEQSLQAKIEKVDSKIDLVEARLVAKLGGITAALMALLFAALKLT